MVSHQLHLSWKDHSGTLLSVFEILLKNNILVDCTLAAEGQYLKAHKMVLSACSSYFELLFSQENEKNPIVILKDVGFQELKAAVNFMYTGEVDVYEDRLTAFLEVADSLQIKGLKYDRNTQCTHENSLLVEISSPKSVISPWQHLRKDELSSLSGNADQSPNVSANCELVKNIEPCSVPQSSLSESSCPSSTLPLLSSFSLRGQNTWRDEGILNKFQSSLEALPQGSSGENERSGINPILKNEPAPDTYGEEKTVEVDMDFEDGVIIKEDREDWDKHNEKTKNDNQSTNQQDHGVEYGSDPLVPMNRRTTRSSMKLYPSGATGGHLGDDISSARMNSSLLPQESLQSEDEKRIWLQSQNVFSSNLNVEKPILINKRTLLHKCPYCNYTSERQADLTIHLRTHSEERPFKCPHCTFASKTKSNIKIHIRSHTGEKPYKCPECDYKANNSSHLKEHRRIHSGEKPYHCPFCDYRARQSSSILLHKRSSLYKFGYPGFKIVRNRNVHLAGEVSGHLFLHFHPGQM